MDEVIDFSNCKRVHVTYGGTDRKFGVIYNDDVYMLKFAKKHANRTNTSTSYINNALSEYIGSHIAQSMGLTTHETKLGVFNNEIVVGCKDFRFQNSIAIIEFSEYVRAKYNSFEVKQSIKLNQIYDTLKDPKSEIPDTLQKELIARYWDTFVVDALVGNVNRSTDDWGLLIENGKLKLAPVYDFGSCLFPEISDDVAESLLNNRTEMLNNCLFVPSSQLSIINKKVGYYDMMSSNYDSNCTNAVLRVVPKTDIAKINHIIDNTPFITDVRKSFYKHVIRLRNDLILSQSYTRCCGNNFDIESKEHLTTRHID
ncbi:MAG: HipA domain-containing protein [Clostridiales bacterium]|nr:HipA domain-containing protein [Clostridiales bacterium]